MSSSVNFRPDGYIGVIEAQAQDGPLILCVQTDYNMKSLVTVELVRATIDLAKRNKTKAYSFGPDVYSLDIDYVSNCLNSKYLELGNFDEEYCDEYGLIAGLSKAEEDDTTVIIVTNGKMTDTEQFIQDTQSGVIRLDHFRQFTLVFPHFSEQTEMDSTVKTFEAFKNPITGKLIPCKVIKLEDWPSTTTPDELQAKCQTLMSELASEAKAFRFSMDKSYNYFRFGETKYLKIHHELTSDNVARYFQANMDVAREVLERMLNLLTHRIGYIVKRTGEHCYSCESFYVQLHNALKIVFKRIGRQKSYVEFFNGIRTKMSQGAHRNRRSIEMFDEFVMSTYKEPTKTTFIRECLSKCKGRMVSLTPEISSHVIINAIRDNSYGLMEKLMSKLFAKDPLFYTCDNVPDEITETSKAMIITDETAKPKQIRQALSTVFHQYSDCLVMGHQSFYVAMWLLTSEIQLSTQVHEMLLNGTIRDQAYMDKMMGVIDGRFDPLRSPAHKTYHFVSKLVQLLVAYPELIENSEHGQAIYEFYAPLARLFRICWLVQHKKYQLPFETQIEVDPTSTDEEIEHVTVKTNVTQEVFLAMLSDQLRVNDALLELLQKGNMPKASQYIVLAEPRTTEPLGIPNVPYKHGDITHNVSVPNAILAQLREMIVTLNSTGIIQRPTASDEFMCISCVCPAHYTECVIVNECRGRVCEDCIPRYCPEPEKGKLFEPFLYQCPCKCQVFDKAPEEVKNFFQANPGGMPPGNAGRFCEECGKLFIGEILCGGDPANLSMKCEPCLNVLPANIKNCPGCGVPTELREGCNHITCTHCLRLRLPNPHWCFKCGEFNAHTAREVYNHMETVHGNIYN